MSQDPKARPRTLFLLGLTLLDRFREQEEAWVEALPGLKRAVDGVLLALPSWQEAQNAIRHPLVQRVIHLCDGCGFDLYWGRRLWITWQSHANPREQHKSDVYNPAYYAAYLSRLHAEVSAIGAKGTFAECEPYGDTIFKPWFKSDGFTWWQRRKVLAGIAAAKQVAPAATMAYPAGGRHPEQFAWSMRYLGEQFLHSSTYKLQHPEQVYATPPRRMPLQLDWWGSWVTATGDGKTGALTIEQYRGLDWAEIRSAYPELQGSWIFAAREDRLKVMEAIRDSTLSWPSTGSVYPEDLGANPKATPL